MRRRLIAALGLLAVIAASYSGYWFYISGLVRQGVLDWAEARRVEGFSAGWDRMGVGGFPFAITVRLEKPVLGQSRDAPAWDAQLPELVGEAAPWAPHRWRLLAAEGGRLRIAPSETRPPLEIDVGRLDGTIAPAAEPDPPGTAVTLHGTTIHVQADQRLAMDEASIRAIVPARAVTSHREIWTRSASWFRGIHLPAKVGPLGDTIDEIAADVAVKGAVPQGPRRAALEKWRQAGGTVELENFRLAWGALHGTATGTLALDEAMQPMGAGKATLLGYGTILDTLVDAGTMKPGDAMLARLGLGILSKPGPDGASQLEAAVTIQNGILSIAQFKVARLPHFTWD
jgi:hypothetical protein